MTPDPPLPLAPVVSLARSWDGAVLVVVDCPRCAHHHLHGGGTVLAVGAVSAVALGHHTAHCLDTGLRADGYVVTDPDLVLDDEVARLLPLRLPRRG